MPFKKSSLLALIPLGLLAAATVTLFTQSNDSDDQEHSRRIEQKEALMASQVEKRKDIIKGDFAYAKDCIGDGRGAHIKSCELIVNSVNFESFEAPMLVADSLMDMVSNSKADFEARVGGSRNKVLDVTEQYMNVGTQLVAKALAECAESECGEEKLTYFIFARDDIAKARVHLIKLKKNSA